MERPSHAQLLARRLNQKKSSSSSGGNGGAGAGEGGKEGKFASPTDQLMSPCTQKLRDNKGLLYKKAKPLSLQNRFAQVANANSAADAGGQDAAAEGTLVKHAPVVAEERTGKENLGF